MASLTNIAHQWSETCYSKPPSRARLKPSFHASIGRPSIRFAEMIPPALGLEPAPVLYSSSVALCGPGSRLDER